MLSDKKKALELVAAGATIALSGLDGELLLHPADGSEAVELDLRVLQRLQKAGEVVRADPTDRTSVWMIFCAPEHVPQRA